jgi:hypothetical protein
LGIGYGEIGPYTVWAFQAGLRHGALRRESALRYLWRAPATVIAVLLSAFFLSTTLFVHEIDVLYLLSVVVEVLKDEKGERHDDRNSQKAVGQLRSDRIVVRDLRVG